MTIRSHNLKSFALKLLSYHFIFLVLCILCKLIILSMNKISHSEELEEKYVHALPNVKCIKYEIDR